MSLFDRVTRGILEMNLPVEQHKHIESFQNSVSFWANRNLNLMRKWLAVTELMLKKPYQDGNVRDFFIRINGVVIEMADHFEEQADFYQKIFEVTSIDDIGAKLSELKNRSTENYIGHLLDASKILSQLRSEYTDEEQRWIIYFRNLECHPMLTRLSVRLKKSGFRGVEKAEEFQRIAEKEDSLDVYEKLYLKFQSHTPLLSKIEDKIRSMQFS